MTGKQTVSIKPDELGLISECGVNIPYILGKTDTSKRAYKARRRGRVQLEGNRENVTPSAPPHDPTTPPSLLEFWH